MRFAVNDTPSHVGLRSSDTGSPISPSGYPDQLESLSCRRVVVFGIADIYAQRRLRLGLYEIYPYRFPDRFKGTTPPPYPSAVNR